MNRNTGRLPQRLQEDTLYFGEVYMNSNTNKGARSLKKATTALSNIFKK